MSTETVDPVVETPAAATAPKSDIFAKFNAGMNKNKVSEPAPETTTETVETPPIAAAEIPINPAFEAFNRATKKKEEIVPATAEVPKPGSKEENIANLRKSKEEWEKKYQDLEKVHKEIQGKIPTDYETIRQKAAKQEEDLKLLTDEVKKYSLASLPEFKEKYDSKIKASVDTISKTLGTADGVGTGDGEVNPVVFLDIVQRPESKSRTKEIASLVSNLDEYSKAKVSNAIAEFDRVREQRDAELANPDPSLKYSEEQRATQIKARQEATARKIEDVIATAPKEIPWLQKGEDATWNGVIDALNTQARDIWTKPSTEEQHATYAYRAAMTPLVCNLLSHAQQENERLHADIKRLRGNNPTVNPADPAKAAETKSKTPFTDKFLTTMKGK
jgi:hypothetical protein